VINLPDVKEVWLKQGVIPLVKTPGEFDAYLRKDIEKWANVVKVSGAKIQ
jgi:tripartite-type tricarboxylate transporter receptor subunit TctC